MLRLRIVALVMAALVSGPAVAVDVVVSRLVDVPDPAVRGGVIAYTLDVENQQADVAADVTLAFPLPASTVFVSVDNPSCSHDGGTPGTVNCSFGDLLGTGALPPGPVETAVISLRSGAATGAIVNVTATASTSSVDTNPANDSLTQNTTIDDGADLFPTFVSALPDPVTASGNVTYVVDVDNAGPNDASNVAVVFAISPNMVYQSASGSGWSCSYNSGSRELACDRGSLSSGTTAPQITFSGQVVQAQTGVLTTTATVSSDTADPEPNNDVDSINVTVAEGTDLAVTIVATPSSVIENNATSLVLSPRNLGPFDASNAVVTTTVPADFTIDELNITSGGWSCAVVGQDISCSRSAFAVGVADDITVPLTAPGVAVRTTYSAIPANITSDTAEPAERLANNDDTTAITVDPNGADLTISKSKSPNPVAQGSQITSTIRVTNNGPQSAASGTVTVQDVLDTPNETYVGFSGSNWVCIDNSPAIDCTYNAGISNGATASTLVITTLAASGDVDLTNTATVSYSGSPGDYDSGNDSDNGTVRSTTNIADLRVVKAADADVSDGDIATLAANEDTVTYTVTVTNDGPNPVDGVTITDDVPVYIGSNGGSVVTANITSAPAGVTFGACSAGNSVSCTQTGGSIASGESVVLTITASRPLRDGMRTNTAQAFSSTVGDNDRSNNSDTSTVTIVPVADIQVTGKTVTPNPVLAGVNTTYTITVNNGGPSTAQDVEVVDTFTLPGGDPGFTFVSATPTQGSCAGLVAGQAYTAADAPVALTCDLNSMGRGDTETIQVVIRPNWVSGSAPRSFANEAVATTSTWESDDTDNDGDGEDEAGSNNRRSATLDITPAEIDLLVNNADTPDPLAWDPAAGGDSAENDVVYDVEVTNRGPSLATGTEFVYTMTPKDGKSVRWECDEAGATDSCGTSADNCSITSGSNPVVGPATLELTCAIGDMVANETRNRYLTFRVLTNPDAEGDTHATLATVSANEDETNSANNAEAETTSVRGKVDLALTKTPTPGSVELHQPFVWTITATNNGPIDSNVTQVVDTLPATMRFYGEEPNWNNPLDGTNGVCATAGRDLTCDLGFVSVSGVVTITVPVIVDTYSQPSLENCASGTTNGVDVLPANNTDICASVTVLNSYFPADYGDAPDTGAGTGFGDYATTYTDAGPRHLQPGGDTWLGACVDSDGDGTQQSAAADADDVGVGTVTAGSCDGDDDEDGISLPPAFVAGRSATLGVDVAGGTCGFDAWIDFNRDGDFEDAGEQVFAAESLAVGAHSLSVAVPDGIAVGSSYARFRCSTAGGLTAVEETTGGEVEDYVVSLQPEPAVDPTPTDYGDAPDTGLGRGPQNYETLVINDGPSHVLGVVNAPYLGSCVDSDTGIEQGVDALADDIAPAGGVAVPVVVGACVDGDDEDGVVFDPVLRQGVATAFAVTAASGVADCTLSAWVDFDGNGDFTDPGEQIATDLLIASGNTTTLTPTVPVDAVLGDTYARFRCASESGLGPVGAAQDGEVEDYRVEVRPDLTTTPVDFGDAPDSAAGTGAGDYDTIDASSGPSHILGVVGAPYLGACVDGDDGTAANATADAENTGPAGTVDLVVGTCAVANEDEDGVVLPGLLGLGRVHFITVTTGPVAACVVNGWIDWNGDGDFDDADEQIITESSQAASETRSYAVSVPTSANTGTTYARFRCNSAGALGPVGAAADGEVEDYRVQIVPTEIPALPLWAMWSLILAVVAGAWRRLRRAGCQPAEFW